MRGCARSTATWLRTSTPPSAGSAKPRPDASATIADDRREPDRRPRKGRRPQRDRRQMKWRQRRVARTEAVARPQTATTTRTPTDAPIGARHGPVGQRPALPLQPPDAAEQGHRHRRRGRRCRSARGRPAARGDPRRPAPRGSGPRRRRPAGRASAARRSAPRPRSSPDRGRARRGRCRTARRARTARAPRRPRRGARRSAATAASTYHGAADPIDAHATPPTKNAPQPELDEGARRRAPDRARTTPACSDASTTRIRSDGGESGTVGHDRSAHVIQRVCSRRATKCDCADLSRRGTTAR